MRVWPLSWILVATLGWMPAPALAIGCSEERADLYDALARCLRAVDAMTDFSQAAAEGEVPPEVVARAIAMEDQCRAAAGFILRTYADSVGAADGPDPHTQ